MKFSFALTSSSDRISSLEPHPHLKFSIVELEMISLCSMRIENNEIRIRILGTVGWKRRKSIERKVFSFSFLGCSVFLEIVLLRGNFLEEINKKKFHFIINAKLYIMFRIISGGFILVEIIHVQRRRPTLHVEIRARDIICLILIVQ